MTSDEALMLACRDGSSDAFGELFARYRQPVWAYFRRRVVDVARAEDLAQETFVAVLKGARRYEPRSPFRSYLFGIAFNIVSAERRRARVDRGNVSADDVAGGRPVSVDDVLLVRQALAKLEDGEREIVMLREFEELSYDEIARTINVPLNTVRSRLFRARASLRQHLGTG